MVQELGLKREMWEMSGRRKGRELERGAQESLHMKKQSGWSRGWRFERTLGGKVKSKS